MTAAPLTTLRRDPVCGMMVDAATAKAKVDHAGETYFFCHPGCATKFQANPEQYLKPRPAASGLVTLGGRKPQSPPEALPSSAENDAYVCPMCPEVRES